ncbi:hypothetical protein [Streptomyces sp. NPDC090022]|uniref:hypothetical protein n=1 Tax=Streptomyces sp. NPDC090022 TaxID=3365920 RepID=UPI00380F5487
MATAAVLFTAGCSTQINQNGGPNSICGDMSTCANDNGGGNRSADPDGGSPSPVSSGSSSASPSASRTSGDRPVDGPATPRPTATKSSASPTRKPDTDLSAYPTATIYADNVPLFRVVWVETPKNEVQFSGVGRTQIRARGAEGVGYHMRVPSTSSFRVNGSSGSLDYAFVGPDSRLLLVRNPGTCSSNCSALNPTRNGSAVPYTTILQVTAGSLMRVPVGSVMTYRLD